MKSRWVSRPVWLGISSRLAGYLVPFGGNPAGYEIPTYYEEFLPGFDMGAARADDRLTAFTPRPSSGQSIASLARIFTPEPPAAH